MLSSLNRCLRGVRSNGTTPARSTASWAITEIASRGLIHVRGPTAETLLHGIVSNEVKKMPVNTALYAGSFHPKGRLLYDLIVTHLPPSSLINTQETPSQDYLIDCDAEKVAEIISHFQKFDIRKRVAFTDISSMYSTWQAWSTKGSPSPLTIKENEGASVLKISDPRSKTLGHRLIVQKGKTPNIENSEPKSKDSYQILRMAHGIAEGAAELGFGELVPLEANFDLLQGISWTKGCYQGQELSARTHYRGVVRKRILPVRLVPRTKAVAYESLLQSTQQDYASMALHQSCLPLFVDASFSLPRTTEHNNIGNVESDSTTSDTLSHLSFELSLDTEDAVQNTQESSSPRKNTVGSLLASSGNVGLAMVYLENVGKPIVLRGNRDVYVVPYFPDWWPKASVQGSAEAVQ